MVPLDAALRERVAGLRVRVEQLPHVGHTSDLLADLAHSREALGMAVLQGDEAIGFYRIDLHPRSVAGRDFDEPTLGLRGFFIDARWQRRGLGRQALAALLDDLAVRLPWARWLVLGVDCSNIAALSVYRDAGFVDDGQLYDGGPAGAQLLMLRALP